LLSFITSSWICQFSNCSFRVLSPGLSADARRFEAAVGHEHGHDHRVFAAIERRWSRPGDRYPNTLAEVGRPPRSRLNPTGIMCR